MFAQLLRGMFAALLMAVFLQAAPAVAGPGEGSFSPTTYLVPVWRLAVYSEPGHVYTTVFDCSEGEPRCYLDFGSGLPGVVANEFFEREIAAGVYSGIAIQTCNPGESSAELQVGGEVTLGGTTYFLSGNESLLRSDVSESRLVNIPLDGCALEFPFPQPRLIQPDRPVALQLAFASRNAGFASTGDLGDWDGCVRDATGSVCVATPAMVFADYNESLRLENYLISEDLTDETGATAGGELLMVIDSSNRPFAGFSRRFYSETSVFPTVLYDTPFAECLPADDGTVSIKTYDTGGATYRSWFPAFQRANHTGTLTLPDGTSTIPYRAYRQAL